MKSLEKRDVVIETNTISNRKKNELDIIKSIFMIKRENENRIEKKE